MIRTVRINQCMKHFSSKNQELLNDIDMPDIFYNRNPRNLERLRIAYKPSGYHLEAPGREYWHRLSLEQRSRYVVGSVVHNTGVTAVTASTAESAIRRYLYRATDVSAYHNLGRVLAQRCLESGITEIFSNLSTEQSEKITAFLTAMETGGVCLKEPERFCTPRPWDKHREEKPWEVTE